MRRCRVSGVDELRPTQVCESGDLPIYWSDYGGWTSDGPRHYAGSAVRVTAALGELQPHDLLRLYDPMLLSRSAPKWVQVSPTRSVWVVVRRAAAPDGRISVGVRGMQRNQRWTTTVSVPDVAQIVTPEQLVYRIGQLRSEMPAAQALVALRGQLQRLPCGGGRPAAPDLN